MKNIGKKFREVVCEIAIIFIISIIVAILICDYICVQTTILGSSMESTLSDGDKAYMSRIYSVKRGDIVVFSNPCGDELLVKRCIAIPGDTIEINKSGVYINGKKIDEPYIKDNYTGDGYLLSTPTTLKDDEYIFLGDNRAYSFDSRNFGAVKKSDIYGVMW